MQGIDYSFSRPGGAAIKAAGKDFVVRYCPYPGAGGKALTKEELADLHNNGLAVVLVFESTAGRVKQGQMAGIADGSIVRQAMIDLGFPADRPCYFAVDFDAAPTDQPAIDQYLRGAAEVLGVNRVGVYGSYYVVMRCHQNGTAKWLWQTYAWSGGQKYIGIDLYQYQNGQKLNGGDVDFDEAYNADFGQWGTTPKEDMTNQQFIQTVATVTQGQTPYSQAGMDNWLQALANGHTPESMLTQFLADGGWLDPNAARDLKTQLKTATDQVTADETVLAQENGEVNDLKAQVEDQATKNKALVDQMATLNDKLTNATRPIVQCDHNTMTGWQLISLGVSQLIKQLRG